MSRTPDHITAFGLSFATIWHSTPFAMQVNNLAYFRQFTCFLGSTQNDIDDRRKLMYQFLSHDFNITADDDILNERYNTIPVSESISRVLRNLCTLYSIAPNRKFEKETPKLIDAYADGKVNKKLKHAHKVGKICNTALVMPHVRDGKIEIDVLPPDLFRFESESNDFRKLKALWIPICKVDSNGQNVYTFKVWTKEYYFTMDSEGRETSQEKNKYGMIPACVLQFNDTDSTDFYGGGAMELIYATLDNNKLTFLANSDVLSSAFSVWIATNFGKESTKLSPNRIVKVDKVVQGEGFEVPPSLENVSGNALFQNIEEMRNERYKEALRKAELPESLVSSNPGIAPSGAALMVDRMGLMEIRRDDVEVMSGLENEFYPIFAKVLNIELGLGLPDENRISIDYIEQKEYIEPKDEQLALEAQFNAGILGAKDFLSAFVTNENITTDEQAIEYMRKNKELLKKLNSTVQDGNVPDETPIIDKAKV